MSKSKNRIRITRFYRLVIGIFLLKFVLLNLFNWDRDDDEQRNAIEDYSSPNCHETQFMGIDTIVTQRSWLDYAYTDHCLAYTTTENQFDSSRYFRKNLSVGFAFTQAQYWGEIYRALAQQDMDLLLPLADSLYQIAVTSKMDRNEFANLVVSFVQDIPYSFVLPDATCHNEDLSFYCVENERFGLLGPLEFLHTLRGDCDTRTLLLYTLFKHFDYSPVIVNSWKYLHSMLLLDVVATGDYIEHQGKRLYFWETTATGWRAGELPPDMSDKSSWEIILE